MLDVFNQNAFSTVSLTAFVNAEPFVPGAVGAGLQWEEQGIATRTVVVEEDAGALSLIESKPLGAPAAQFSPSKRKVRSFVVPHLPLEDSVLASEVAGVRAFGSEDQLQTVEGVVQDRIRKMLRAHDATLEYGRVGAVKGLILDADGSTLYNLFTEFGVSQQALALDLGTASTDVLGKCVEVQEMAEDELGAATTTGYKGYVGKNLFKKLIAHPKVREAYTGWQAAQALTKDNRQGFVFGDVEWIAYRGKVGGTAFVGDDEGYVCPVGVPGLFITRFASADFNETANTIGLPRYAKQEPMPMGRGMNIHTQSNPLSLCTRPRAVIKVTVA